MLIETVLFRDPLYHIEYVLIYLVYSSDQLLYFYCMVVYEVPHLHGYTDPATAIFGLYTHKWGIFALVGDPLQSHLQET